MSTPISRRGLTDTQREIHLARRLLGGSRVQPKSTWEARASLGQGNCPLSCTHLLTGQLLPQGSLHSCVPGTWLFHQNSIFTKANGSFHKVDSHAFFSPEKFVCPLTFVIKLEHLFIRSERHKGVRGPSVQRKCVLPREPRQSTNRTLRALWKKAHVRPPPPQDSASYNYGHSKPC